MTGGSFEPVAEVCRGGRVESLHHGAAALVDPRGDVLGMIGDPDVPVVLRSAIKFVQAMPFFMEGVPERMGLTRQEQAVVISSHSGQEMHTSAVRRILDLCGLDVSHLGCGRHRPFHSPTSRSVGEGYSALHSNCSGKHAMMLATCVHLGLDVAGYLHPDHPLQRRIRSMTAAIFGVPVETLSPLVDGCNAPIYAAPLSSLARGYATCAASWSWARDVERIRAQEAGGRAAAGAPEDGAVGTATPGGDGGAAMKRGGDGRQVGERDERQVGAGRATTISSGKGPPEHIPEEWARALARIADLHLEHPRMIAGDGRMDTDAMLALNRSGPRALCKVGGEAVHGTALLREGLGLALKVADGEFRALGPMLVGCLDQFGLMAELLERERVDGPPDGATPSLRGLREPDVKSVPGDVVGWVRPIFKVTRRLDVDELKKKALPGLP